MSRITLLAILLTGSALSACNPFYVMRAGYEQARIMSATVPIGEVLADPETPADTRHKLTLVLEARDFAEHEMGLNVGDSYTTFAQLRSDTLIHVVSAARPDRFEAHTWWFPIVGRVPYKGFFSESAARREVHRLDDRGLDTHMRPAGAFSTLGWFNDPLYSTLLRHGDVPLVNTVIHELLHNTVWIPGDAAFNESFANFVGARGAIDFFCRGDRAEECEQARDLWQDDLRFGAFLGALVAELDEIYESELPTEEILARREEVFERARRVFTEEVQPGFRVATFAAFERAPLNNATLLSRRLYYRELDLFEQAYQTTELGLPALVRRIEEDIDRTGDDPWTVVERLAGGSEGATP